MSDRPLFSVVMATHGRGRHIEPSIKSVLQQTLDNFELLVVGDGRNDETEAAVKSFSDTRVSWHSLPQNTGSQSFPNNEGIRVSRGEWIAYLGHDDIWSRDHLASFRALSARKPDADFLVSGCVFHLPPGVAAYYVHGIFEDSDLPGKYFFPPSSIAHRRDVTERIGSWRDPRSIASPVDLEFMSRAVEAGLRFVSTGKITVHKFAAGHRYLSYLRVASHEQNDMLKMMANGSEPDPADILAAAKRDGTFMNPIQETKPSTPGFLFEQNRQNKGIARLPLTPLAGRTVIRQTNEGRALDWRPPKWRLLRKVRQSGSNPRPKILIPYTGDTAQIIFQIYNSDLADLSLYAEDRTIPFQIKMGWTGFSMIVADIPLKHDDYTVLTFGRSAGYSSKVEGTPPNRGARITIANIILTPTHT